MDAVSEVLSARAGKGDGLSSMLGASVMAHIAVVAVFLFVPAWWFGAENKAPETIMQISLGGPVGPNDGRDGDAWAAAPFNRRCRSSRRRPSNRCVRRRRRRPR